MSYADPDAPFVIDHATIRMPYVPDRKKTTVDTWPVVTPDSPLWLRRIVGQVSLQFKRETRFDFQPYCAADPDGQHVILWESQRFIIGQAVLIAGAIGIHHADTDPFLGWVGVHPYERGQKLVDQMWSKVLRRYSGIRGVGEDCDSQNTPTGNALLDRLSKLGPTGSFD
jgi:hypothetical protein